MPFLLATMKGMGYGRKASGSEKVAGAAKEFGALVKVFSESPRRLSFPLCACC
eukprot:SAG31_NODE_3_length_45830_cov_42.279701_37_plen_53_part_00